jgi:hypothetical protein
MLLQGFSSGVKVTVSELSSWANWSTIAASVTAVLALTISAFQFYLTQRSSRESQAIDLYLKWNNLYIDEENNRHAANKTTLNVESSYWYDNCKLAITEALFEVTYGSREWSATVEYMLKRQGKSVSEDGLKWDTYSPRFRKLLRKSLHDQKSPPR